MPSVCPEINFISGHTQRLPEVELALNMQISVLKYKFVTLKIYVASRVQQTLTLVLSDYL